MCRISSFSRRSRFIELSARIIVEIKAVDTVLAVHHAQLLSYLRLTKKPLGLFINFNVPVLVKGVKRIMNGYDAAALESGARS